MSFKSRLFASIALFLAVSALQGCARLGFGEKIPAPEPLKVRGGESACLNQAGTIIEDYISARTGVESINSMFECVDRSIQLFLDKTRTSTPGIYQPMELRNFIEKFFIGEDKISNALMAETMEFKRSVLGGRGDILTADELRSARRIMAALRRQLIRLDRYRPLTISSLAALAPAAQNEVLGQIAEVATDFGSELSSNAGDYSMARFESLLREFQRAFPGDGLNRLINRFKLIRMFKPVLFGTSADEFRGEEWPRFLRTAARIFGIYVKIQPIYPDESGRFPVLSCGSGLQRLREAGLEFFTLLEESVRYHGSLQLIPFIELSRVIDALDATDFPQIRRLSMKKFLRPIVRRYLAGETEGALGRDAEGITLLSVDRARKAFLDWADGQRYIEGVFQRLSSFDCQGNPESWPSYSISELESVSIESALNVGRLDELDTRTVLAIEKLRKVLHARVPMHAITGSKLRIDPSGPRTVFVYNDLLQANWLSIGFALGQQGYREKRYDYIRQAARQPEGMVVEEVEEFYSDLREIGTDLKFIDPDQWDAARLRSRDGSLFMPSADGDLRILNLAEAIELMGTMISAKAVSGEIQDSMLAVCRSVPGGMFETRLIEEPCYRERLIQGLDQYFANLPALVRYVGGLKSVDQVRFFDLLFKNSKVPGISKEGYMEINDSDRLATILHYVELVFSRFDVDFSSRMETGECLKAFDLFESILSETAKGKVSDRESLRALFTYMLSRGKIPETALEKAGFLWWKSRGPRNWDLKVDRSAILSIFAKLAETSGKGSARPTLSPVSAIPAN
jgi:hypothetical protein